MTAGLLALAFVMTSSCCVWAEGNIQDRLGPSVYPLGGYQQSTLSPMFLQNRNLRLRHRATFGDSTNPFERRIAMRNQGLKRTDEYRMNRQSMAAPQYISPATSNCLKRAFQNQPPDHRCSPTGMNSSHAEVLGAKRFEISGLKKHLSHDTVVTDARLFFYASPRRVTMRVECGDMACDDDDAAACEDACSKSWSDDSISLTRLTTSCAVLNLDRWIEANKNVLLSGGRVLVKAVCAGGLSCPQPLFFMTFTQRDGSCPGSK